jgi:hypothetical protein
MVARGWGIPHTVLLADPRALMTAVRQIEAEAAEMERRSR